MSKSSFTFSQADAEQLRAWLLSELVSLDYSMELPAAIGSQGSMEPVPLSQSLRQQIEYMEVRL